MGLHGRADGRLQPFDIDVIRRSKVQAVKLLSSADPNDVVRLKEVKADIFVVVRLFASFNNRDITPSDFVSFIAKESEAFYRQGVKHFEVHNEPNLIAEGLGHSWTTGVGFGMWYCEVVRQLRLLLPAARFGFPGVSPGNTLANVRQNSTEFLRQALPIAQSYIDWMGVHCYWQTALGMRDTRDGKYYEVVLNMLDRPVMLTEFSNVSPVVSKTSKAQQYINYYQMLQDDGKVMAAFAFVSSASRGFEYESWYHNNELTAIPDIVGTAMATGHITVEQAWTGARVRLTGNSYVRDGVGTLGTKRLTALYAGTELMVQEERLGPNNMPWCRVTGDGWMSSAYLSRVYLW